MSSDVSSPWMICQLPFCWLPQGSVTTSQLPVLQPRGSQRDSPVPASFPKQNYLNEPRTSCDDKASSSASRGGGASAFRPWSCLWGDGGAFPSAAVSGVSLVGQPCVRHRTKPVPLGQQFQDPSIPPSSEGAGSDLLSHLILSGLSDFQLTDKEPGHLATLQRQTGSQRGAGVPLPGNHGSQVPWPPLWKGLTGVTASS